MGKAEILAIDDDAAYENLYKEILESKGYSVRIGRDAYEGYQLAQEKTPDLIILDAMMPEHKGFRDGYDLLLRLRADERTRAVPVIMVTALGDADDKKHGMELGASLYVSKQEMRPDILVAHVSRILAMSGKE